MGFDSCSDFLFARPSLLSGAARTLDIGGTFDRYNESAGSADADRRALAADVRSIGRDFYRAIDAFKKNG